MKTFNTVWQKTPKKDIPSHVKESQEVMEKFAYLIEDIFEKSDVVSAATSILDELQDMAEKVAMIQAKDVMPLLDSITTAFGPEVAQRFNSVTSEQTTQLVSQIQAAKTAIDTEVNRMKAGVEGGDMSDMGMMGDDDDAPVESPQEAPEANLPDMPIDNNKGAEEDGKLMRHGADNFAGRARKESVKFRGKKIEEDFLPSDSSKPNSTPSAEFKSENFDDNLENINNFHGRAGTLAHTIAADIRTEALSHTERKALASVLSHFSAYCHDASHWGIDPEAKLTTALEAEGIFDLNLKPAIKKIVVELRELVSVICHTHKTMTESAIRELKKSSNPDALILNTFRTKLSETRDAQKSAIRTARLFAIDLDDVISIVKESARNHMGEREQQTYAGWRKAIIAAAKGKKIEWIGNKDIGEAHIDGKAIGEWDGVKGCLYNLKEGNFGTFAGPKQEPKPFGKKVMKVKCHKCDGKGYSEDHGIKDRFNRPLINSCSKCNGSGKIDKAKVAEADFLNAPMFPVGATSAPTNTATTGNNQITPPATAGKPNRLPSNAPTVGQQSVNQSSSTIGPKGPADARADKIANASAQQVPSSNMPPKTGTPTMVPPNETENGEPLPPNKKPQMMNNRQVTPNR